MRGRHGRGLLQRAIRIEDHAFDGGEVEQRGLVADVQPRDESGGGFLFGVEFERCGGGGRGTAMKDWLRTRAFALEDVS